MNAPASSSAQQIATLTDAARAQQSKSRFRGRRGRALIVAIVGIVVVIALLATNAFGSSGTDYRTADAAYQRVDALLSGVGTIEPISQATVAFPVSGTVGSVSVKTGDRVDVGQTLAALDTQSLTDTLHQKQSALAQAQLTLSRALAGQSVAASSGGGASNFSSGSGTTQSALRTDPADAVFTAVKTDTGTDPQLAAAQQAVLSAQQQVDATMATAATALTSATNVCGDFVDKTGKDAASNSSNQLAADAANPPANPPANPATPPPDDGLSACQSAIKDVQTAQAAVADAEKALGGALTTLDNLLAQRAAAAPAPTPSQPAPTTGGSSGSGADTGGARSGGTGAGGSASGGSGSGGFNGGASSSGSTGRSSTPSAADLASYQAAVDAADAQVSAAQQALSQATIASPIAGTVVAVNLTPGASVSGASTTNNVIVQGDGGFEVSTTIGIDRITHVAVGQLASVVPDGTHTALEGHVSSIGVRPDSNSSTTSYLVVIGLDNANEALHNGSTGLVSIVTQSAKSALAVPTSAITTTGNRHTVELLDGDTPKTVNVRVGVMGATWTEIKSGLTKGQPVVVADMSQALPGSATSSTNSNQLNTNQLDRNAFINRFGTGGFRGAGGGR